MQDGVTEQNLRENMVGFYRREDPDGELALVLGAGNVSAIVPLDILDRMINCGEVVVCKMNPVNDYLGPIFEDILAPLVRDGYLAFVYGAGDVGEYLTRHDAVQAIHITGSAHARPDRVRPGGGRPAAQGGRRPGRRQADQLRAWRCRRDDRAAGSLDRGRLPVPVRARGHAEAAQLRA
jgi:aldehyde dehydrogenase (NAD(P)+)